LYLTKKKNSCPPATAVAAAVAAASGYNNDSPNALPLLPASDRFPSFAPPISSSAFAQTTHPLPLSETLLSPSLYAVWRRGGRALTIVAPRSSAAGHDGCAHFLPSFFFFFLGAPGWRPFGWPEILAFLHSFRGGPAHPRGINFFLTKLKLI